MRSIDTGKLPAADNLLNKSMCIVEELLATAKRKIPDGRADEHICSIARRDSPFKIQKVGVLITGQSDIQAAGSQVIDIGEQLGPRVRNNGG